MKKLILPQVTMGQTTIPLPIWVIVIEYLSLRLNKSTNVKKIIQSIFCNYLSPLSPRNISKILMFVKSVVTLMTCQRVRMHQQRSLLKITILRWRKESTHSCKVTREGWAVEVKLSLGLIRGPTQAKLSQCVAPSSKDPKVFKLQVVLWAWLVFLRIRTVVLRLVAL